MPYTLWPIDASREILRSLTDGVPNFLCATEVEAVGLANKIWESVKEIVPVDAALVHSKVAGIGFENGQYIAVYSMNTEALARGQYEYRGHEEYVLGIVCPDAFGPGVFRCYRPCGSPESAKSIYEWRGDYTVQKRPWYLEGRLKEGWTKKYADPQNIVNLPEYTLES
ncbi:hypothetical protein CYMTET_29873 [Cymbomonas tetramitiformis]|uniref:Uncharacterized protein n=1 Tax=Cymbomonas tetramitiformis TaxID=36881 RepID=A0AAE0FKJ8_9CHLO|nr:hypothetical protein CYMTET_29873 [Cymbomonas tetramitiformis]